MAFYTAILGEPDVILSGERGLIAVFDAADGSRLLVVPECHGCDGSGVLRLRTRRSEAEIDAALRRAGFRPPIWLVCGRGRSRLFVMRDPDGNRVFVRMT